jgi:quaternary ammonium compound-resistance protein SugE
LSWILLIIAGLLEIVWGVGLKMSDGFTKLYPSMITGISYLLSLYFLSLALKEIPVSTGYIVWTGLGATGIAIIGMFYLDESRDFIKIICILLIISGILGLKFLSK